MLTVSQLLRLTPTTVRRRATEEWIKIQTNRKQKRYGKNFRSIYAWVIALPEAGAAVGSAALA